MKNQLQENWDLDVFFPGGSSSQFFSEYLINLEKNINTFTDLVKNSASSRTTPQWEDIFNGMQDLMADLGQASAFLGCSSSQNIFDRTAQRLAGNIRELSALFTKTKILIEQQMLALSDKEWQILMESPILKPIQFFLEETKKMSQLKLPPEQETLASSLATDGYHAWGSLYDSKVVSRVFIEMDEGSQTRKLSIGQAANLLTENDRQVRKNAFIEIEKAWQREADLCAAALNHLAGYRINLYRARNWDSVLKEPLLINRMTQETLNTMWQVVNEGKAKILQYLKRKAQILNIEKLSWFDLGAPIGNTSKKIPYEEGAEFVIEQFNRFNPEMADFARNAFKNRWIEVENRPCKSPGAFCASFPKSLESRVFMTYSGTPSNVATLAHELGHAYHSYVLNDLPLFNKRYSMSVAETASTFSELVVADASIKNAPDEATALILLEDKIQRTASFYMDIHCRFIFETRFYERRKKGLLSIEELNNLMEEAQKEAYCNALETYHPYFWAAKGHFYSTGVPFYNFPYTFGYLFSSGIYARAQEEGPGFAHKYVDLLRDTCRMTVEDLARKHLDTDLTKPDFWRKAVASNMADIDIFLALTQS